VSRLKRPREPPGNKRKTDFWSRKRNVYHGIGRLIRPPEKRGGIIMAEKMEKARKREMIESVVEKFVLLPESDKTFIAGYLVGKEEERAKWEKRQQVATA